jgi:hypothetical protein
MTDENQPKRLRFMRRYTAEWERLANELALRFAPRIYPCAHCGGPVVDGYCCNRCGSSNPHGELE